MTSLMPLDPRLWYFSMALLTREQCAELAEVPSDAPANGDLWIGVTAID
jgi:hypothetical protein